MHHEDSKNAKKDKVASCLFILCNHLKPRKRGTLAGGRSAWSAALSDSRPVRVPPSGGFVVGQAASYV